MQWCKIYLNGLLNLKDQIIILLPIVFKAIDILKDFMVNKYKNLKSK